MKLLYQYLKAYKKESILAPLFKMLEALFELFVPLVIAGIIDVGIVNRDYGYLIRSGLLLLGLGIVGLCCSITAQYFAAKAAVGFGTKLKDALYKKINGFTYAQMDTVGISTLLTRITSDATQVQTGLNLILRLFLRSPFIVAGSIIAAFYLDPKSAMIFVIGIPILALVVFAIMFYTMPYYENVQRKLDGVLLHVRENLTGVRVIRAFNRQEKEVEGFEVECGELYRLQVFVGKISALLNPITYIVVNGAILCLLWVGGSQVSLGIYETGVVVALVNYMSQILIELVKLANLLIQVSKGVASVNRIVDIFQMEEGMKDGSIELEEGIQSITFENVSFSYPGARDYALEHISFTVKKGETLGIIGSTGSGKSTLAHLLPRYYDVAEGTIYLNDRSIQEYVIDSIHHAVRIVPQKAVLFQGTVRENLRMGLPNATDEEMMWALDVSMSGNLGVKNGSVLDYEIAEGGKNLSGGQRQRLTIARALMNRPSVLILDDSSSALDNETDFKLRKGLKDCCKDSITILISQRATSLKQADQIIVLEEGVMVGIGTHEELLEKCEIYQEICQSQLTESES